MSEVSIDALQARYREERDTRLRADTVAQYRELAEVFTDVDRDPFTPRYERDPIAERIEVAIIDVGLGGLTAARLAEQGLTDIRIIEKAGDFGALGIGIVIRALPAIPNPTLPAAD